MKNILMIGGIYIFIGSSIIAAVINIGVAVRNISKRLKYKRTQKRRCKNRYIN